MPRKTSSQWEFGELFEPAKPAKPAKPAERTGTAESAGTEPPAPAPAPPPARRIFSVGELTGRIRRKLEAEFGTLWVTGEVSNLRHQGSGHAYFTLKDAASQLSCVLFRGEARENRQHLQDGQHVVLNGTLTVYEPRGQYQLRVTGVELQGVGALQLAFERLKQKLQAEGLFDPARKRSLPRFSQCMGLVTSPTGAAIRDVLHVIERRQPGLEIILAPCRVQGEGAAREIAGAIGLLNAWALAGHAMDLILVTRGGGSLEDLWAFNEEIVGHAIFDSHLPVVSAVGHEIDFTISDFVADLRAATPSAAAELITEGPHSSRQYVAEAAQRMRLRVRQRLASDREDLERWVQRLGRVHPRRVVEERLQTLDDLQMALGRSVRSGIRRHGVTWGNLRQRLGRLRPSLVVERHRQSLRDWQRRMVERARRALEGHRTAGSRLEERLRLLGPDNVLQRGYSITTDARAGTVIRSASDVRAGQTLRTRFKTGEVESTVTGETARRRPEIAD
jgi:exodeoxyribonuclease VII large subunit